MPAHATDSAVRTTPLVQSAATVDRLGDVWFKLENLQRTGSFKLRGAVNKLAGLSAEDRRRGVVTASAGNHGAGLALAARSLGIEAVVFVPELTPAVKRDRIAALGADVVVAGAIYDEASVFAHQRADDTSAVFVSAYDDDAIIAGNGIGLGEEILTQLPRTTRVVCPVGGGGLIGGLGARLAPDGIAVIGVQPETNCAMHESLALGRALTEYAGRPTLAEGCEGAVAERTYALAAEHVDRIALVSEPAIRRAVAFCYRDLGTIVECSAAVAVAGLLEGAIERDDDGATVVVLTGGNIEPALLDDILATDR